ncbi:MAG TPA: aspartate kinase [Rhodoblastus sp.]|nr:aspartate kinase [Rhodoblastus sp.]
MSLLVARIGDGLATMPHLKIWLDALAAWPGALVIAPGGGPFGGAARSAARAMGLNAVAAQRLALMAMDQYAVALAAVRPSPVIAETEDQLRAAIDARRIAIWAPARMAAAATDIPATSEISSDSLAAWLAGKLGAAHLLLIEDADPPAPVSTAWLARRARVDTRFPDFAALAGCPTWIAGSGACAEAEGVLAAGRLPGVRVTAMRRT